MKQPADDLGGYPGGDAESSYAHAYFLPELDEVLAQAAPDSEDG